MQSNSTLSISEWIFFPYDMEKELFGQSQNQLLFILLLLLK